MLKRIFSDIKFIYKKTKMVFVWGILSFIIFLILINGTYYENLSSILKYWFLFLIPTIIFFLLIYLVVKDKLSLKIAKIIAYPLVFLSFFYYPYILLVNALDEAIYGYSKISTYYKLYDDLDNDTKKHLPKKIPNEKEAIFHFNPSFLQGGSLFSLYFKTTREEIDNYVEEFSSIAISPKDFAQPDFTYTPYKGKLSQDFELYYLDGKCDDSGYCNHGLYSVAAINKNTNEIIFEMSGW